MLNRENVTRLAEHLKGVPHYRGTLEGLTGASEAVRKGLAGFNMQAWCGRGDCGTVGCVAGHAVALLAPEGPPEGSWYQSIMAEAGFLLGLPADCREPLFELRGVPYDSFTGITPQQASAALRFIAAAPHEPTPDSVAQAWYDALIHVDAPSEGGWLCGVCGKPDGCDCAAFGCPCESCRQYYREGGDID